MQKAVKMSFLALGRVEVYSGGQNPFNVLNFEKEVFMEIVIKYEK